jgi:hypothetical protein
MYQPLAPCPSCRRHVRTTEASCPFCAAALPGDLADRVIPAPPGRLSRWGRKRPQTPAPEGRLSRAAVFLFGASLAVTGCGSDVTTDRSAAGVGGSGGAGGNTATGTTSTGGDTGGDVPLYGGPPPDFDAGPDDDGGGQAEYGGPPPSDAGSGSGEDGGSIPIYGSPPPPP